MELGQSTSRKRTIEAILYHLRAGCRWRALPHNFPPWSTVASHFRLWQKRGVWQQAVLVLGTRWREVSLGRARRAPRHALLDSQSVKAAAEGQERGFHGGKKVKGRSRPIAVDSQGTLLAVHVTAANKADGAEAAAVMAQAVERHPSLESFTADKGCQRQAETAAHQRLGRDLHVIAKPTSTAQKRLCAHRLLLAHRAHLRVVWPVPPTLQGVRKDRRLLRSVALVRDDALARASAFMSATQVLRGTEFTLELFPGKQLIPDISVYKRTPVDLRHDVVCATEPPLLTVKILSSSQGLEELLEKVDFYLVNGVKSVWLVIPAPRTVTIFLPDGGQVNHDDGVVCDPATGLAANLDVVFS